MLIFNPNYHEYLKKLKAKEHMGSELKRLLHNADGPKAVRYNKA